MLNFLKILLFCFVFINKLTYHFSCQTDIVFLYIKFIGMKPFSDRQLIFLKMYAVISVKLTEISIKK